MTKLERQSRIPIGGRFCFLTTPFFDIRVQAMHVSVAYDHKAKELGHLLISHQINTQLPYVERIFIYEMMMGDLSNRELFSFYLYVGHSKRF